MYVQKISRQQYYLPSSPRNLTSYTEGRLCKYFLPTAFPAKKRHNHDNDTYKQEIKVRSPNGDTDYLDILAGVLQRDTLAPYLFINCLEYVLRPSIDLMKENNLKLTKERSRRYHTKTITDTDYIDDTELLANTPIPDKSLLHSLERAAGGISLHVNAEKTTYVLYSKRQHLHTKGLFSESCRQVHLQWKQRLMHREWH